MKKNLTLLFAFALISITGYSQLSDYFIEELKASCQRSIPKSFFVIQASTQLPVFTQAPQIIERLEEIGKNQLCPYVIMVWKDDGGIGKHFDQYLKKNYYIESGPFTQVVVSEKLYEMLGEKSNTAIHYFYNQKHFKSIDGKHERMTDFMPYDLVSFSYDGKYALQDDNYYHSNQVDYYPINNSVAIELFDGHEDRVRLTNTLTGQVLKVFDLKSVDYLGVFHRYMNYLNISEDEIKKNNEYLSSIKRSPLRVDKAYIKSINEIYLVGSVMISYKTHETRYIPGDYKKETIEIKKGDYITESFSLIIETDSSFVVKGIEIVDSFRDNEYNRSNFVDSAGGLYISEGNYYFFGYNYSKYKDKTYKQFYKRNKNTQFIHCFVNDDDRYPLKFNSKGLAELSRPLGDFYFYQEGVYFFGNGEKIYSTLDLFPEIYSYDAKVPVTKISNQELTYSFKNNSYDSLSIEQMPYYCFFSGLLLNNNVLAFLHRERNSFFVKLYDSKLNLIQTINITNQLHLRNEMNSIFYYSNMAFFSDNFLNTTYCSGDGCFNHRYQINFEETNLRYFDRLKKFVR